MIWCLVDLGRLQREREALESLQQRSDWLINSAWLLDGGDLCIDADIQVGTREFPIRLRYPYHFPHTPPSVWPRNVDERWSDHQYGRGGELCLEHGPDNWHVDLTGADMLESAWRLLSAGVDNGLVSAIAEVPSRHETTIGQDWRGVYYRLAATWSLAVKLRRLPPGRAYDASAICVWQGRRVTAAVTSIQTADSDQWSDVTVPGEQLVDYGIRYSGLVVRLPDVKEVPNQSDMAAMIAALRETGIDMGVLDAQDAAEPRWLLVTSGQYPQFFWKRSVSSDALTRFDTMVPPDLDVQRLEGAYAGLASMSVGIVGCGSLGSKVATSLARSGVGRFVLVDDDILMHDNLVRHDLDWLAVGAHKADALSRRLTLVNPTVTHSVWRVRLAGQEGSGSINAVLKALGQCDLVIDATANPAAFNLLAKVVELDRKPIIWAEVFAGGIGGLVARHRPGIEPDPQTMRRTILAWCADQGEPPPEGLSDYEAAPGSEGPPLIADDGDVSLIASCVARMATDAMVARMPSRFPHAAYMIGLAQGWIFREPYDTRPIDVGKAASTSVTTPLSEGMISDNASFLADLLPPPDEAASSP